MTSLKYVWFALALTGVVLLLPWLMEARDRQITVDSLEKAYASRIAYLDAQIASTTVAQNVAIEVSRKNCLSKRVGCYDFTSPEAQKLQLELNTLKFERQSITPAYNLLVEALK